MGTGKAPTPAIRHRRPPWKALTGLAWITGYPGGPPSRAGSSYVDFLSTWTALFAIGAALRYRSRTGQGQWIDLAMYQAGAMAISEYILDYTVNGRPGQRTGNRHPFRAPQGCYRATGADEWVTLSVGSDDQWQALCEMMGQPGLAQNPRFDGVLARVQNHDELDFILNQWTSVYDKYKLMEMLQSAGIPAGPVLNNKETHLDPHLKAREFLEYVSFPRERDIGTRPFIGRPYKFSKSPLKIRGPAPTLGQHNGPVLMELLGVSEEEYLAMEQQAIIGKIPITDEPVFPTPISKQVQEGRLGGWDPDYRGLLGIS